MIPALVDAEVPQPAPRRRGGRRGGGQGAIEGGRGDERGAKGMEIEEKKEGGEAAEARGTELATQQRGGELSPFEQLIPQGTKKCNRCAQVELVAFVQHRALGQQGPKVLLQGLVLTMCVLFTR